MLMKEAMLLNEMAMSRADAISRCYGIGKQFIIHFHKIYTSPDDTTTINHWASELQGWYNEARDIRLKPKNKPLNNSQMKDWFYSFGNSYEEFFNEDAEEIDAYETFIDLLDASDDVKESIYKVVY